MPHAECPPIVDVGDGTAAGIYVLRIWVERAAQVVFGSFARGAAIAVARGHYVYIGSALGGQGSPALARRVLRHLTRTNRQPPHDLCRPAAAHFALTPPADKRLRWHIDYLLDLPQAQVDQVVVLRTPHRRPFSGEAEVARALHRLEGCSPVAPGLGASDDPGATHLLCWRGTPEQWQQTLVWLQTFPQTWASTRCGEC